MKAIIVGRHTPDLGDSSNIQVIEQRSITWDNIPVLVEGQVWNLIGVAREREAAILFQNTPGQLVGALFTVLRRAREQALVMPLLGIIVSVPGERPAGKEITWSCDDAHVTASVLNLVHEVNPRAKVKIIESYALNITVDPPMRFEFSHIEWLNGEYYD